ncbi:flagellar hook protein [Actinoplanes sp. SE50]|uniref:flagellar hook-associated protein FlgK n=1 Tax=unclassified Actinoplanes TaxID=2626549 RepID=UPI00023EDEBB|nr:MULTISPECIES: flagellar hook-associated protein FlgK [unclassified Actinoplanes]AEV88775.1 Flagellar hook-associated protein 1 [Actinoplanes sp. SE50/110]ATO87181.1 flagellar hook protein [Actinoplanes sp. SE50]SLM04599.1 flagellar hook-associated protein FlgK [Actinoplanes sp. SE50/110]
MGSTFSGLNTALTSLYAQRRGLDVTGQNIANANTEGYTRQRVNLQSQNGNVVPGVYATTSAVGGGVTVSSVDRLRNAALDQRSYSEHSASAYHNARAGQFNLVEDVFAEPSDTALQGRLADMWEGWNAVAANPSDLSAKSAMLEQSSTVAATLNDAASALNNQYQAARTGLNTYVDDVNKAADSVAKLNNQIVIATQAGLSANELQDQRGQQILKLSELIGASATEQPNGAINVFVGSAPLVSGFNTRQIEIEPGSATRIEDLATSEVNLRWSDTKAAVGAGGTMGASMELLAKGGTLDAMTKRLDTVADKLATTVNAIYKKGYAVDGTQGESFFVRNDTGADTGVTAAQIKVAITNPAKVAISSGDPTGAPTAASPGGTPKVLDGNQADAIAELADSRTGADAEYKSMIGELGVSAQSAIRRRDVQNAVTDQVDAARDSEAGVNLDEEMTHMLTYQRGYEAASRVLTTIDSMLDQLINRTGMVGR